MTKEEILELAEELLCGSYPNSNGIFQAPLNIEKFYRAAFAAGQVEMRERAAIESWQHYMKACQMQNFSAGEFGAFIAAASIRALPIEGEK